MNKVTKVALVAAVVVTLSAIVPNANASGVAKWGGSTGTFSNSCEFKTNTVGVMALTDNVWTATTPAVVKLKTRNMNNVKVTPTDGKVRKASNGADVGAFAIDYATSTVTGGGVGDATVNINTGNINIDSLNSGTGAKVFTINIDGTATMTNTDALESSTAYIIKHTVTCTQ